MSSASRSFRLTFFITNRSHKGLDRLANLAQASLFTALAELVGTYGEDAVAKFAEGLPSRIRNGEFSVTRAKQ